MAAEGAQGQKYLVLLWPIIGLVGLLFTAHFFIPRPDANPKPAPIPLYVPTTQERAEIASQKKRDAAFWSAKAKREANEVSDYYAVQQAVGGVAVSGETGPLNGSSTQGYSDTVFGAGIYLRETPPQGSSNSAKGAGQARGTPGLTF